MADTVATLGIVRNKDFLYYVKAGDVWRAPRRRPGVPKGTPERVAQVGLTMDASFVYFVDRHGDIARAPRTVGRWPAHRSRDTSDAARGRDRRS